MRKIIQFEATGDAIFVLMDDGSIWRHWGQPGHEWICLGIPGEDKSDGGVEEGGLLKKLNNERNIGTIGNEYGGLVVKQDGGKYYWSIEGYGGDDWQEIPRNLYDALVRFDEVGMEGE